ncbi:hypothetical protein SPI_01385 [Niveomyces insectorum RCEF 264]|uniref:Infection structure specific protein n=1 Tax=Niveomyces insectorum RCEF 264 TaxID=1081102 RepID=A0A167YXD1_9HYPO|nr:hypothetical protein SPI_01385 [Niveomyces insectorum RCEF 264]
MQSKALLLASLAAATASALELYPGHQALRRDLLAARQTALPSADESGLMACATALESAYESLPTPPAQLESYVATVSIDDPCTFTYPASISSALKSYESDVSTWFDSHSAAIESALSQCPEYSSYGDLGGSSIGSDVCSTGAPGGSGAGGSDSGPTTTADKTGTKTTAGTGGSTATGTGSGSDSGSGSGSGSGATTTSATPNAGPRETALAGAAILAAAGVFGAMVAL